MNREARFTELYRSQVKLAIAIIAALVFGLIGLITPASGADEGVRSSDTATTTGEPIGAEATEVGVLTLKEGDSVKVAFPGVPSMDTTQQVRQDGRIVLPLVGEVMAAGKTTDALTTELMDLYAPKLVSKEVTVTLLSAPFTIYVTGSVLRPGKITADRRVTAFDAIMEAGGFDRARANLKSVVVIRQENGQSRRYSVNLQRILSGKDDTPFFLKPFDTVYVPEKFNWF